MQPWQGPCRRKAPELFASIARTAVPLNVDAILRAKVNGYEHLATTVGLTTTLMSVPREDGDVYTFDLRAAPMPAGMTVRINKSQMKSFNRYFLEKMAPMTAAVSSAVANDQAADPATRALAAVVESQVASLDEVAAGLEQLRQRQDVSDSNVSSLKRSLDATQQQLAHEAEWIKQLARRSRWNDRQVESLQAKLPDMKRAIEAAMANQLERMGASAADRCRKIIIEMLTSESRIEGAAPASGSSQVKCYVCLEDIEGGEDPVILCDQQSHAIHAACYRGILSAAGTDTGDGHHVLSWTPTCGCCRQRRAGDVFAPLPQPMAVAQSGPPIGSPTGEGEDEGEGEGGGGAGGGGGGEVSAEHQGDAPQRQAGRQALPRTHGYIHARAMYTGADERGPLGQRRNAEMHAEAGWFYQYLVPGSLPGDGDQASSIAVQEGQDGMGNHLVAPDGSMRTPPQMDWHARSADGTIALGGGGESGEVGGGEGGGGNGEGEGEDEGEGEGGGGDGGGGGGEVSAEHQGDGAPTDEQAIMKVLEMGYERPMVASHARRYRLAKKTRGSVLTPLILARLVMGDDDP